MYASGNTRMYTQVIESESALNAALKGCANRPAVVYFRADWVAPCKQMDVVIKALAAQHKGVVFLQVFPVVAVAFVFSFEQRLSG